MKSWIRLSALLAGALTSLLAVHPAGAAGGTWAAAASLGTARAYLGAAVGTDGRLYAVGGQNSAGVTSVVEAYTAATNTWTPVASTLYSHSLGLGVTAGTDGRVFALGGSTRLGLAEVYTPATNTWAVLPMMPTARHGLATATGADGTVYALGGMSANGVTGVVEAYSPATNTWTAVASMPTARYGLAVATAPDGRIFAVGGYDAGANAVSTVEAYTPATNTWAAAASLPTARGGLAAALGPDGLIYALGGNTSDFGPTNLATAEVYTPTTNTWGPETPMPTAREWLAAAKGSDGKVYAIGGHNSTGYLATVEAFTPAPATPPPPPNVCGEQGDNGGDHQNPKFPRPAAGDRFADNSCENGDGGGAPGD